MQCVSGVVLKSDGEAFRGYLAFENGIIVESGEGEPPCPPIEKGLILPLLLNGHTHIGDRAFKGRIDPGLGLQKIVVPPGGLKHQLLSQTRESVLIAGMKAGLDEMTETGTGAFLDFREGGISGVEMLRTALEIGTDRPHPEAIILSRPGELRLDKQELSRLLRLSSGIGISALSDWEYTELEKIAKEVHRKKRILAMHASESVREDIDLILDLKPDVLVHLTSAAPSDLERVAEAGIPVVVCPRANSLFGLIPDIPLMLEKGINLSLGTDNLMFESPDIFSEMRFAYRISHRLSKKRGKAPTTHEIYQMTGHNIGKVLKVNWGISPGDRAGFMVLSTPEIEPEDATGALMRGVKIALLVKQKYQWRPENGRIQQNTHTN